MSASRWPERPRLGARRESGGVLYFAYGSNLDGAQMRQRCPSAVVVSTASLPNHALAFGGFSHRWGGAVASIVRARGASVEGLLYRISAADAQTLDRFEGCPFAYERTTKLVVDEGGRKRRAATYLQPEDRFDPWVPPPGYFTAIWRAYDRLGFDHKALLRAAAVPT